MLDELEKSKRLTETSLAERSTKSDKDSRTHEHEQQRLKKAADFVKARERKSRQGSGWVKNDKQAHRQPESRKSSGGAMVTASSEKDKRQWILEDTGDDDFEGVVLSDNDSNGMDSSGMLVPEHPRYEVKLADLIKVGKPRKPKGMTRNRSPYPSFDL
jgi:hypothetical protein